jgi:dTDP-4-amino-4,6-dideoxygalactose transaminase
MKNEARDIGSLFGGFPGARHIGERELFHITEVVRKQAPYRFYGSSDNVYVSDLVEQQLRQLFGRDHAMLVNSGTSALYIALQVLNIKSSDEVIVGSYGWCSDVMAILAVGARPVIVPVDENLQIDLSAVEKAITSHTRAILAIGMRGLPGTHYKLRKLCDSKSLHLIEDSSQSFNPEVESLADIQTLSFQTNKLITSGEGGCILFDRSDYHQAAKAAHDVGLVRQPGRADPRGLNTLFSFGLNFRISELQSAMLLGQLENYPAIKSSLKTNNEYIRNFFDNHEYRETFDWILPELSNNAFLCGRVRPGYDVDETVNALNRSGGEFSRVQGDDAHHYKVWTEFFVKNGVKHKIYPLLGQIDATSRHFFGEISSLTKN